VPYLIFALGLRAKALIPHQIAQKYNRLIPRFPHIEAIAVFRDYGTAVEVVSGLEPTDRIIVNRADSLEDGQQVNVASPKS
jgi:hypothetical protein